MIYGFSKYIQTYYKYFLVFYSNFSAKHNISNHYDGISTTT